MRKIMISLLMAGAALVPAAAQAQDSGAERRAMREQARADRAAAREDRSAMRAEAPPAREDRQAVQAERPATPANVGAAREARLQQQRVQQQQFQQQQQQQQQVQQQLRWGQDARASARADRQAQREAVRQSQVERSPTVPNPGPRIVTPNGVRESRIAALQQDRAARQAQYAALRAARRNAPPPPVSRTPQPNTQPPMPTGLRPAVMPQWSTAWRSNNRYDWYNYRRHHHWLFNLGFYYDPFGWGYSPFSIGYRMWPSYYGSSYWLNDPWQYRLPYAPPGTRWIRYYDDAILVDMWDGQVLDVIYDFFW